MAVSSALVKRKQELRMNTFNVNAPSSAQAICSFDNIEYNRSSGSPLFSVANDLTLGTRITILARCKASAMWVGEFITAQRIGWSKNASSLTTSLASLATSQRLAYITASANQACPTSFSEVILEPGDVIRPHNGNTGSRGGTPSDYFLIFSAEQVTDTLA